MSRPDPDLPFFAYGLFQRGQLGWLRIRDAVTKAVVATVPGQLLERDGLALLDRDGDGHVNGDLLTFDPQASVDAYGAVVELEPEKHYLWAETEAESAAGTTIANILVGRSPRKGSTILDVPWDGRSDPAFASGLRVVRELMEEPERPVPGDARGFFRLQAAYLLLWTAIERYGAFRHGLSRSPMQNVEAVAAEPTFRKALTEFVDRRDRVYRTDDPRKSERLDPTDPKKSINYYYQLRSNVAHRGKGAFDDFHRLQAALGELLEVFETLLRAAFDEASA